MRWLLLLLGCSQRRTPPEPAPPPPPSPVIAITDTADVPTAPPPPDVPAVDAGPSIARHTRGPWRRLAVVGYAATDVVGRWDDAPDLDGDGNLDAMVAVRWTRTTTCRAQDDGRPCPELTPELLNGAEGEGPVLVAWVARYASDAQSEESLTDASPGVGSGRLLGTRALLQQSMAHPSVRLSTVQFSEFGPGVMVRAVLDVSGSTQDTVDVIDLLGGATLDTTIGSIVHHCARVGTGAVRSGRLAATLPSDLPLVWRAASGHPFSGCPTEAATLDATMSEPLAGGVSVTVLTDTVADHHANIRLAMEGESLAMIAEARTRVHRHHHDAGTDAGSVADPWTIDTLHVLDVTRVCSEERVRYTVEGRRCEVRVGRDDAALFGCSGQPSAFDPAPPRAVLLRATPDADPRLVYSRGAKLVEVALPRTCTRSHHRETATDAGGTFPPGSLVSPSGRYVLFANGFDVWLGDTQSGALNLLNPPGGSIARGTVRAMAFESDTTVGLVVSTHFVRATITTRAREEAVPRTLTVTREELQRQG